MHVFSSLQAVDNPQPQEIRDVLVQTGLDIGIEVTSVAVALVSDVKY